MEPLTLTDTKTCPTCQVTKPTGAFARARNSSDGLHNRCRACNTESARRSAELHEKHPNAQTVQDVANALGKSAGFVRQLIRDGLLDAIDFSHPKSVKHAWRVEPKAVVEYLARTNRPQPVVEPVEDARDRIPTDPAISGPWHAAIEHSLQQAERSLQHVRELLTKAVNA